MLGGAIIGQGTYGCAVRPPFLCKGQARAARKDQAKIGKVTLESDAETEIEISKVLRKEKLWKNYFILVDEKTCQPVKELHVEDWSGCKVFKDHKPSELRQVISPFGGKSFLTLGDLDLYNKHVDLGKFVNQLLEAGALLALNGVCHFDIHKGNILIDKYKVTRLIDFGMAFQRNKIDTDVLINRWKVFDPQYDSEPPEITIITGVRKGISIEEAIHLTFIKKPIIRKYADMYVGKIDQAMEKKMYKFFRRSKSFMSSNYVDFFKTWWTKFDAFAIGAILLYVYLSIVRRRLIPLEKQEKLEKIVGLLLSVDPMNRIDCVEALAIWDRNNVVLKKGNAWLESRKKDWERIDPWLRKDRYFVPPY